MFSKKYIVIFDSIGFAPDFENAIRQYDGYAKITESSWIIISTMQPVDISNDLLRFLPTGSKLFVSKISSPSAWTNVYNAEWLKRNM